MKWLLTFLGGMLVGALALFIYLRQVAHEPAPAAVAPAPAPAPAAAPAPASAAVPSGAQLEAGLPPAPQVEPDLTEADLPLRPAPQALAALPVLPAAAGAAAPAGLMVPVEGVKASQLTDTFNQHRGKERRHEALDIMAPKGTRVLAVADGKVVKLFNSKPGGLTVYQFDAAEKYAYYYAHLDRYAEGVKEGTQLHRGDLVGYVGSTGNANREAPHLHFAVVALTPEKQWWKGTPVDPFPLLAD